MKPANSAHRHLLLYVIIISILGKLLFVEALYEDQIGKFDWRKQYVGRVEHAHFSPTNRRVTVGTNQNVVASLNLRNGNIAWRQIYESDRRGNINVVKGWQEEAFVLSGGGKMLRHWDIATGHLLREIPLVIPLTEESVVMNSYQMLPKEEQVVAVHLTSSFAMHVSAVNITSGSLVWAKTWSVPWRTQRISCEFVGDQYLVCADENSIYSLKLGPHYAFSVTPLPVFEGKRGNNLRVEILPLHVVTETPVHAFVVSLDSERGILATIQNDEIKILRQMFGVICVNIVEAKGEVMIFFLSKQNGRIKLQSVPWDNIQDAWNAVDIQLPSHYGNPEIMWTFVFLRKEGEPTYRVLLTMQDDSLILLQINSSSDGTILWSRHEALASVVSVEMIDLPVSDSDIQFEQEFRFEDANLLTMLLKRLTSQLFQLESTILTVVNGLKPRTSTSGSATHQPVNRDVFNLNKIIVLVSLSGKIIGIDSCNGKIMWQLLIPNLGPFEDRQLLLFTQTKTAHFARVPQCAVIGTNAITGKGLIFQFHPITGEEIQGGLVELDFYVAQVTLLPDSDDNFLQGFLFLDTSGQVHTYPKSAAEVAGRMSSSLFLYTANKKDGVVSGYSLSSDGHKLVAVPVWNINLPAGHRISHIVAKHVNEHVHSQGRVMGDRSVMYKYLNPNLVAIVTEGNDSQLKPFLNIILVDVINGNIVFSGIHKRCRGPIHLVLSENWVVYAYYSEKARRNELTVLELYEGKIQSNTTAFSSLDPPQLPMVERQAYLFTPGLDAMSVTMTEKGITSKHILFAMPNGGIVELPKSLLDPRRSVIPTQEHREESIYPYIPELPIPSESIINYNQSAYHIRRITTAPAGLESTCLVLAYGLDLFFARVTPSRNFDVLKDDFDHFLITIVLLALIFGAYLTRQLAARKALRQAWK